MRGKRAGFEDSYFNIRVNSKLQSTSDKEISNFINQYPSCFSNCNLRIEIGEFAFDRSSFN